MFSRPPSTITTPAAQRMLGPNCFSNSSGMVITPESRSGLMQKPGDADHEHGDGLEHARDRAGKPVS